MTISTGSVSVSATPTAAGDYRYRLAFLLAALIVILIGYQESLFSMVKIWNESETFAHGYLIFPISLYIIYENRWRLQNVRLVTFWPALPLIFAAGLSWWLTRITEIQILHQLAFVSLIPLTVLFFLGWSATKQILFPLTFLFLAVPFGTDLIPIMIDFTADFVVFAIRVVGIPIYREGTFFILPTGSWSVVSGCSGMRYLMATITVGLLFAYMNYRSLKRRILFMIAACIVAVVANWLRAFGIVMIAHYSGMKLALGVDHYVYGWVFFGIIVFALMGLGRIWQEEPLQESPNDEQRHTSITSTPITNVAVFVVMAALIMWPTYFNYVAKRTGPVGYDTPIFAGDAGWVTESGALTTWEPKFFGNDRLIKTVFTKNEQRVGSFVAWYPTQSKGAEVISDRNHLVYEKHKVWRKFSHESVLLNEDSEPSKVLESSLKSSSKQLLIWQWYWVAGNHTTSTYLSKYYEALGSLTGNGNGGGAIVLYTEVDEGQTGFDAARSRLKAFTTEYGPHLDKLLDSTSN